MSVNYPSGYYNLFDPSKSYYELLTLAGFVPQSREANEIQSTLKYIIQSGFDTLYKNGELVSGGEIVPQTTSNVYGLNAARFYWNGIVYAVPANTLTLSGNGTETIGITVTSMAVTASQDTSLVDPAAGAPNQGQPGAARLKTTCTWTLNDPKAVVLYTFVNGAEQAQPTVGTVDVVTPALARRTYDEAGDFVVTGFDLSTAPASPTQFKVQTDNKNLQSGYTGSKAYVQGQEIIKILPDSVLLDRPLATRAVTGQQFAYTGASELFPFPSQPVVTGGVTQLIATFDVVRTVTNHNYNGYDELIQAGETLVSVIAAYHSGTPSAQTTPYVQASGQTGTGDYYQSGNGIRWDVAGSATDPVTAGDTYQVYCLVSRVVTSSQYAVTQSNGISNLDTTGMNPKPYHTNQVTGLGVTSQNMIVNYNFQLSRIDVVYLNADGTLGVSKGAPEVKPTAPLTPGGVLALGQVAMPAGCDYDTAVITQYPTKRLTMADLQGILTRLQNAEYNIAKQDLDSEAQTRAGNSITTLKGILTESFTYTATDIQNDGVGGISTLKFVKSEMVGPMIDITNRQLTLPVSVVDVNLAPTTGGATATIRPSAIMAPYTASPGVAQLNATEYIQVNKFASGGAPLYQKLTLFPTGDSSTETQTVTLDSVDPNSPLLSANNWNADMRTFKVDSDAQPNIVGFTQSANLYVTDQWIYVSGSGFTPGVALDVKMDGLAPRAITTDITKTVLPLTGQVIRAALNLDASIARVSPAVTFDQTTVSDDGVTYSGSACRPIVNVNGAFDFFIRTPLDATGKPLRSGNKVIAVRSLVGDSASQVFVAAATTTTDIAQVDVTTQVAQAFAAFSAKIPPPVISSVVVQNNATHTPIANVSTTGISASTLLEFVITWDQVKGSTPTSVWVTPDVDGSGNQYKFSLDPQTQVGNSVTYVMHAPTTAAANFVVNAMGTGGAATPYPVAVAYTATPPAPPAPPTLASASFTPDGASASSGVFSYTGLTGSPSKLVLTVTGPVTEQWFYANFNQYGYVSVAGNTYTYALSNPAPSGSIKVTQADNGTNTFVLEAYSATGSLITTISKSLSAYVDPVAETFDVPQDCFIDSIDLFFQAKSATVPVSVEIRTTQAGLPGVPGTTVDNTALASVTLQPAQVNVSSDATAATNFKFDAPVFLSASQQYALVVLTDSGDYTVYTSTVGKPLLLPSGTTPANPPATQVTQAYGDGVMFVSSNSATWTPVQESDLKFQLNQAVFTTGETIVNFNAVTGTDVAGLYLPLTTLLPGTANGNPATRVFYEYQLDGLGSWLAVVPYTYEWFSVIAAASVNIRARLQTDVPNLSPVIDRGTNLKIQQLYRGLSGSYVTKTANYTSAYANVTMTLDADLTGPGTSARWYISDNTAYTGAVPAYDNTHAYAVGDVMQNPDGSQWLCTASSTGNTAPNTSYWTPVKVDMDVVWWELVQAGETVTALSDGIFKEHTRTLTLPSNSGRTQFRFRLDLAVNSVANSVYTPKIRDVMTICNA